MNTGIVSSRYARALLKFAAEAPDSDRLCSQVMTLEKALCDLPQLRSILESHGPAFVDEKIALVNSALGEGLHPALEAFMKLVFRHGRENYLRIMLHHFVDSYFKLHKILRAKLVSVVPSPKLEDRLREIVREKTSCSLVIESSVDPSLVGGFVFTVDDFRIDASVSGQLDVLKRKFAEFSKRLI